MALFLGLVLAGPASAALVKIHVSYEWMQLKDGRRLDEVSIHTYDTMTDRVMIMAAGREALTVPLTNLPDDVAAQVRARIPLQSEDEIAAEKRQLAGEHEDARHRSRELNRHAVADADTNREARRRLDAPAADPAREVERRDRSDIAFAAQQLARDYFTFEDDPHSSKGRVVDVNVSVSPPETVSGWTNRWRVRGYAGIQYITRDIGAVGRERKDFEMLVEVPDEGPAKLVEMTIR